MKQSLIPEEQKILKELKDTYSKVGQSLELMITDGFIVGLESANRSGGVWNKGIPISLVAQPENDPDKAFDHAKAMGIFVGRLKFFDFFQELFKEKNMRIIKEAMSILGEKGFNTNLFIALAEKRFNDIKKTLNVSDFLMSSIEKKFNELCKAMQKN